MSNAAKHRKKAAEFEQLKQIDRAIASYVRAIEESEADGEDVDVALLNKVGDLALRQGRVPDAVTYYERAVEHYATAGLFNNAIALCNKILRNAPGRSNVYFTLGRICARKGLRGDATRNFLDYAARMQQDGRVEEAMRALAEVADLTPELTEVRRLVDEHAERAGVTLPRRRTPPDVEAVVPTEAQRFPGDKSSNLVFLDVDYGAANAPVTPPRTQAATAPVESPFAQRATTPPVTPVFNATLSFIDLDVPTVRPLAVAEAPDAAPLPTLVSSPDPVASPSGFTTNSPEFAPSVLEDIDFAIPTIEPEPSYLELPTLDLVDGDSLLDHELPPIDWRVDTPSLRDDEVLIDVPDEREAADSLTFDAAFAMELVAFDLVDDQTDELPAFDSGTSSDRSADHVDSVSPATDVPESVESVNEEPVVEALDDPADDEYHRESVDYHNASDDAEDQPWNHGPFPEPLDESLVESNDHEREDACAASIEESMARDALPPLLTPAPMLAIEAAIAVGAERALLAAEADPVALQRRPPYRLDPHDFILPGELPPLVVSDELVDEGLVRANTPLGAPVVIAPSRDEPGAFPDSARAVDETTIDPATILAEEADPDGAFLELVESEGEQDPAAFSGQSGAPSKPRPDDQSEQPTAMVRSLELPDAGTDPSLVVDADSPPDDLSAVRLTPSLPIAAVAAEANVVAVSRRDELRALVAERPQDWALRRRLAEALFESGQRDAALAELEASLTGFVQSGQIAHAADVSEVLVGVSPERVSYHQKRVELAVRLQDQQRLRFAYLDLADTLVRSGEEARAQAVYVRVLEIDPLDDRARVALGSAAPPPPTPVAPVPPAEGFVNLADWLREDEAPISTRMRMREPTVSGDEDADFAALLRHFKEGVSRSLGEEDFESRYDLGVAYKEMGLLDDAIAEFQKALRSRTHRLPAYEALGQCFVEQGRYQVAATVLSRALHEPGLNDEQRVGVLYLLAYSCEALQRWGEARSYFQRVYATDINFRDVAARLAALEHIAS